MKNIMRQLIVGLGVVATFVLFQAGSVSAGNALCPANAPADIKNSEVCKNQGDPVAGPGGTNADLALDAIGHGDGLSTDA